MRVFPLGTREIRFAMLGMVEGNGHPYSWSAIFNGYNREHMEKCPFPGIPAYLFRQPYSSLTIPGAKVTHIWTDIPSDAKEVARSSLIPNILEYPEDCIGQVDAVIIPTDIGGEHADRCRPFIEAGLPVFIDKPLADNEEDLRIFLEWIDGGAHILSSSCMRYAKEFLPYRLSHHELGDLRLATITMSKSWERYGIHALEGLYPIVGPGFVSVQNIGGIYRMEHICGAEIAVGIISDMYGGFGHLLLAGTESSVAVKFSDTFFAFKAQLEAFVAYLRTGELPFPFEETIELMKLIIAGVRSRNENGRCVMLNEIPIIKHKA